MEILAFFPDLSEGLVTLLNIYRVVPTPQSKAEVLIVELHNDCSTNCPNCHDQPVKGL